MNAPERHRVTVDVDHNKYLGDGSGTVDAIVTVAVAGSDDADAADSFERVEAIIIDCSTSMTSPAGKFDAAKRATLSAIDELADGTPFTIVAGTHRVRAVYPVDEAAMAASPATRAAAARAVDALTPDGGTAMGRWLAHVRGIAESRPTALTHAILLTDGKDEHETPEELGYEIGRSEGVFTCDCRGVGTDWHVDELRAISSALLGSVDIVADPDDLAADFAAMMRSSMAKSIPDLTLRLWTPAGAQVRFVKQVAPTVEDLTSKRVDDGPQWGRYPLGAWGSEERDYHIQVQVKPGAVGQERLATRVEVRAGDDVLGEGKVTATWTADTALSSRISRRVAHYTGQVKLAEAIQKGMQARKGGDATAAVRDLKRALELAEQSGNTEQVENIRKVIEVDERTGTARLRREVSAAYEMALDARSTRTARVRKES